MTSQSQPGGSGCRPSSSSITYDTQANVTSRTDFSSRKTCYANDLSRNLETARVEGLAGADACPTDVAGYMPVAGSAQRKIQTQWHPDWRLETRRSEPKKLMMWVYHGQPDPTAGGAVASCAPADALVDGCRAQATGARRLTPETAAPAQQGRLLRGFHAPGDRGDAECMGGRDRRSQPDHPAPSERAAAPA